MAIGHTRTAAWLRIFSAMLLLSLGFGHAPVVAQPASFDAAYVLPDGSFSLLCMGGAAQDDAGRDRPASHHRHGCDACLIASAALLPTPPLDHAPAGTGFLTLAFPPVLTVLARRHGRPGTPVRGPPSFIG